ncbi:hypothetical protein FACS1894208_11640 [Clostridia bacterium]|nr:hypothetical protein FACS1894208_11640 [Clostridia bacterium]
MKKRLLASALALIIVLSVSVPGLAAGDAAVSANDDAELTWYYSQVDGGELKLTNAVSTDSMMFAVNALSWKTNSIGFYTTRKQFWAVPRESEADLAKSLAKAKAVVADVIKPGMTRYDKYLALHDWIVNNTIYDIDTLTGGIYAGQSSWDVLINGRAVCNGYANAYKLLCDIAGLPNIFMLGKAGDVDHAWNVVACGGEWLYVDTTWDDPVTGDGSQILRHDYFMLTEDQISTNHKAYLSGDKLKKLEALAYPDREDAAEILHEHGLFDGDGKGDYNLLGIPDRLQGGVMFMRLLGYSPSNLPQSAAHPFTDVADWASGFISAMYALGYTQGVGDGKYGSSAILSLNEYLSFTFTGLGYTLGKDFDWTKADTFAAKLNLLSKGEAEAINLRGLKRGDMALIACRALDGLLENGVKAA